MIIETPPKTKLIDDYDIVFSSGMMIPISVDLAAGDTIDFNNLTIKVHLTSKPSLNDPMKSLLAEDMTFFMAHVVSIQHRVREVIELTPEQQFEWTKVVQELGGTVQ